MIPAFNAADTIEAQLRALDHQTYPEPFDVVVVDNASTDGTADVVREFSPARFSLTIVDERNQGINHARNAGIEAATDGAVLLCDSDDCVHSEWLEAMVAALDPGVWVGGVLDYTKLNVDRTRLIWNMAERSGYAETDPYVDNTYGCNCGFWRSMWSEIGRFDPRLNGSGDENEFFMRAFGAGYRRRHVPDAVVSYRLRPGVRLFLRQRYRQGKSQIAMRQLPGGCLLPDKITLGSEARRLVWTLIVLPRYVWSPRMRYMWLGSMSRHLGRIGALWVGRVPGQAREARTGAGRVATITSTGTHDQ